MTRRPQFGVRLPVAGPLASPEAIRTVAQACERLRYDAVWVNDYIGWTKRQDRTHVSSGSAETAARHDGPPIFFDSLTDLAFLAGITQRIRLGIAILCLPYRNPVITAKQLACIDVLSGGRLIVGVGVGAPAVSHNVDFEILGIPRSTKYARSREHLRVMREIWTQAEPSFQGRFVTLPKTQIDPKPVQKPHPPIWVGGAGPRSVAIAARYGTGWLPPWISPEDYPARIRALRTLAAEKGRGDVDFTIATEVYACVARTSEKARKEAEGTLAVLGRGFAQDATDEAVRAAGLIGSVDAVREKVGRYVAAGVDHFEMKFIYHDIPHLMEQLELFAREIAPDYLAAAAAAREA